MKILTFLSLTPALSLAFSVHSFSNRLATNTHLSQLQISSSSSPWDSPVEAEAAARLVGRYFQMEEMEDAEKSITEVFLDTDNQVYLGLSDGPNYQHASGTWKIHQPTPNGGDDDNDDDVHHLFEMNLYRVFEGGRDPLQDTDMGKFTYQVSRRFKGNLKMVGDRICIEGVVQYIEDDRGTAHVGYFEMIDTNKKDTTFE